MKLWALVPELVLAGLCLGLVPVAGLVRGRWQALPAVLAGAGLVASIVLTARMLPWAPVAAMHGTYAVDGFAHVFKLLVLTGALIALLACAAYFRGRSQRAHLPVALLFCTLGAVGLTSSVDLALIVLFLQMMSMAAYVLVAMMRGHGRAREAALKIFIYGATALAVMSYGLTFLYGLSGSTDLRAIGAAMDRAHPAWAALALILALVGYGFEITLVPFHPWAPDVYEGATAPVAAFISVVPKIAGFAALLRFLLHAYPDGAVHWPMIIAVGAVLTMVLGNLAALRQTRLKRLLAYSSIAQAGYVLVAVAVAGRAPGALIAVTYYLAAYLFMNLGAFAVVTHVERALGTDAIDAFRGLVARAPVAAVVLLLSLLSLAGIPPLAGFVGKVLVLEAALDGGMAWLAWIAAINMVIGLYYYLRVIVEAFLRAPANDAQPLPRATPALRIAYLATAAGTLALGILPAPVFDILQAVTSLLR